MIYNICIYDALKVVPNIGSIVFCAITLPLKPANADHVVSSSDVHGTCHARRSYARWSHARRSDTRRSDGRRSHSSRADARRSHARRSDARRSHARQSHARRADARNVTETQVGLLKSAVDVC